MPIEGQQGADNFALGGAALTFAMAARRQFCLCSVRNVAKVLLLLVCLAATVASVRSQTALPAAPEQSTATIERIDFEGNRRIRSETLQARIFTRAGDPYRPDALRRDFHALWNTQFFDDVRLEVQDSPNRPNSKIVIFHAVERSVIRRIEYRGNKSMSESDILDAFKDRKVGLSVEGQFDPTKIKKAEVVLKDLEAAHGHQFATVTPTYEKIPATNAVKLIFTIDEGPKVKSVGLITFQGNHAFSDRKILRSMKRSKPYAIPMHFFDVPVLAKTFDRNKLDEDVEVGIRGLYQSNGYFKGGGEGSDSENGGRESRGNTGPIPIPVVGKEHGKAANITIPIEEGEQYRMGRLVIRSADPDKGLTLKRETLEAMFPLKKGDLFDVDKIRKAIENYTKVYGVYGFIDFTATPQMDVHDDSKIIDLTFDFDEQKQFFVRRIEFSGNTTTRDKVIRRELLINEGDIFNDHYWEISLLRLNQLNYFDRIKPENAEIKRNTKQGTVDILLKLKEKGKQSISFNGGVSGLAGCFIGLTYQTNNFLGLGETLTLSGQIGTVQRTAVFGFTEPYLFDRPISTGFTVSTSRYTFNQSQQTSLLLGQKIQLNPNIEQDYNQNTTGFTVFASYPIRRFSFARFGLTYGYSDTSIQSFSNASTQLFQLLQFQAVGGPSALSGIHSSKITPTISYNTVDNPTNPTHGRSLFYSASLEGLGGNVKAVTNVVEAKYFRPINRKRNVLAFHFAGAFVTGYGGLDVPPYERLYLGGETDLRGFDIRTVSPIAFIPVVSNVTKTYNNGFGLVSTPPIPELTYLISFPGGDTSGVANAEYRIPIVGPVSASLFTDFGAVGNLRPSQLEISSSGLTNINTAFPGLTSLPGNFPQAGRLQLDPGTNFKPRGSSGIEFVVQLPIINAPFRLYWAYNWDRLEQQVVAHQGTFQSSLLCNTINVVNGSTDCTNSVANAGSVFNQYVLPQLTTDVSNPQRVNFFEPKNTFRFTVSRTF